MGNGRFFVDHPLTRSLSAQRLGAAKIALHRQLIILARAVLSPPPQKSRASAVLKPQLTLR